MCRVILRMSLPTFVMTLIPFSTLITADILQSKTLLVGEPIINGPYEAADPVQASEHVLSIMTSDTPFDSLSDDLRQSVSSLGHNRVGLMRIMDSAVNSTAIFGQVLRYMTTRLDESNCDWTSQMEQVVGSDEKGWRYFNGLDSNQEHSVIDPAMDILDSLVQVQGDDDSHCLWCQDTDQIPEELKEQLDDLWRSEGTRRNQKLAILKYTAWKISGIVWNDDFVKEMGFEDDQDLMESIILSLKDLLLSTDRTQDTGMMENDVDPSQCDMLDPVELINAHYTSTIRELWSIFAEWMELGISPDVSIAMSFGANIGGGIGFAVNGHGEALLYNTVRSPLSMTNRPVVPEQGASLVVSVGIYEDLQSVNGFGITNQVEGSFPEFPNTVFATMYENEQHQWIVNGVILEASFDPIESEYRFGYEMALHSRWSIPIASLVSTKCALEAQGVDINGWKQQYPMMQPLDIELNDDKECGVNVEVENDLNSIRMLESVPKTLPQRRKMKNPEAKLRGKITLIFMGIFVLGLVYIASKIDWIYLIDGGASEQVTLLDGEQKRPLITKEEEEPEIVIW